MPVAMLLYLPVALSMGLQFGLFLAVVAWLGPQPLGLAAPLAFVAIELLFPKLFPWRLGNSQYQVVPLLQSGELAGPFLLGFAIVWVNTAVLALARQVRLGRSGEAREAARFLLLKAPLPVLAKGPYAILTATAVSSLPVWARIPLRLPYLPIAEATGVRFAGHALMRGLRWVTS